MTDKSKNKEKEKLPPDPNRWQVSYEKDTRPDPTHITYSLNRDFAFMELFESAIKDDTTCIEHPVFVPEEGNRVIRTYKGPDTTVTVGTSRQGCATLSDRVLWWYSINQLRLALRQNPKEFPKVFFKAHDFLKDTDQLDQETDNLYERLNNAFFRMRSTDFNVNMKVPGGRDRYGFGLIESWGLDRPVNEPLNINIRIGISKYLWEFSQNYYKLT